LADTVTTDTGALSPLPGEGVQIALPPELVEVIVDAVTDRVFERLEADRPDPSPWLYGAKAAAEYLGWPIGRIQKLTAAGALPSHRIGQRHSYRRDELDEWLGNQDA
jgi:excisionase family DNA binding protein